jgi:hypothetical protein
LQSLGLRQKSNNIGNILQQCASREQHIDDLLTYGQWIDDCLKHKELLNKKQCIGLVGKLLQTMHMIQKINIKNCSDLEYGLIIHELYEVMEKIGRLVTDCARSDWYHATIFQLENREAFRELLLDLKNCSDATWELFSNHPCLEQTDHIQFDMATSSEVEYDKISLKERMEHALKDEAFKDQELVEHLLQRVKDLHRVEGGELDAIELPFYFKKPDLQERIYHGAVVSVYKAKWMGISCVVKILISFPEEKFRQEAGILAGLKHPNIINFFGWGIDKEIGEIGGSYLIMELMEENLSKMLKNHGKIPYLVAIDIIHQIARGMCYLHDMQVVHRDLKPDNVLLTSMTSGAITNDVHCYSYVKLIDFGISKIEVGSKPEPTNHHHYGTPHYMAPEMAQDKATSIINRCYFAADVYSFAMVCSEILSGTKPFSNEKCFRDIVSKSKDGVRPALPTNCEKLTKMIKKCWDPNPSKRPTFSTICVNLTNLKKDFLVGNCSDDIPQFESFDASRSIFNDIQKLNFEDIQSCSPKVQIYTIFFLLLT